MSLMERLIKNSKIGETDNLEDSEFFNNTTTTSTPVPMMNVAFSGHLDVGYGSGLTVWAGPSKHFKTNFGLLQVKSYLDAEPDSICLFYDSEFGAAKEYFGAFGIDPNRVIHSPIVNIEQLKFDLANQLKEIRKGDKVFIFIDSVGNLASKKEVEDAIDEKSVADMTRAKQLKSLFRIVTPQVVMKDLPLAVIAHTYDTQEMFSKKVVGGGTGIYYSANQIFILGRRQVKDGKELEGHEFVVNVEKSRSVKEKAIIPITVLFDGGISKWSGLLEVALHTGAVVKPKNGWYTRPGVEDDKNWRKKDTNCSEFWNPILETEEFKESVHSLYALEAGVMFEEELVPGEDFDPETGEIYEEE